MAADEPPVSKTSTAEVAAESEKTESKKRKINGNLIYLGTPGSIKPVLEKIISASKPDKLTQDYLANVFGLSGSSYRAVLPILKRIGFLTPDGSPTELYSRFRTESGRSEAALGALRNGFAELFKKSEHAYGANDNKLTDLIVETTGLSKDDSVVRLIRSTFRIFSAYLPPNFSAADVGREVSAERTEINIETDRGRDDGSGCLERTMVQKDGQLSLAYNIQIVLPETKDIDVYNIIFRSLRDNLLSR